MSIDDIRREIDELDDAMLDLLSRRASRVLEIGKLKEKTKRDVFDAARERRILDRLVERNQGPLSPEAVRDIFRAVIAAHRQLERDLVIAYFGPPGTFTHMAARKKFGPADLQPVDTIADVFRAVEKREADLGVVPIENTTGGVVQFTLDEFLESKLRICAEIYVDIEHYLLSHAAALSEIKRVYSHSQPLAQCRVWLRTNLPGVETIPVGSTSRAAEMAAEDREAAAIAPALAGELRNVPVLVPRIHDLADNRTRFFVIGHAPAPRSGKDKTSLVFSVRHAAGSLYQALAVLNTHQINMTFIQSHPTKQTQWEYMFFVDVLGHLENPELARAVDDLTAVTLTLRVLGSYPEAE